MFSFLNVMLCVVLYALGALLSASGADAGLSRIAKRMSANGAVCGTARFSVTMPQLSDDVDYGVVFSQLTADGDSLSPVDYLIEWQSPHGGVGFTAYSSGNHYRYNGTGRIQEYHMVSDSIPFMPWRSARGYDGGVQQTARFVDLLPAYVARRLAREAMDERCDVSIRADTLVGGRRYLGVKTVTNSAGGGVAREAEYLLEGEGLLPARVVLENNPGSVSEQTVTVEYSYEGDGCVERIDEDLLVSRYPEEFGRFRTTNFRIENLRGQRLPGFSLPTTTGERYLRMTGDGLRCPTIVAFLESGQYFTPMVVGSVREAVEYLPMGVDVVWVFTDSHVDGAEEAIGELREGEHALMSGAGLARDCGAAMLPSLLIVGADGVVDDVVIGYNKGLGTDVIQKMTFINSKK